MIQRRKNAPGLLFSIASSIMLVSACNNTTPPAPAPEMIDNPEQPKRPVDPLDPPEMPRDQPIFPVGTNPIGDAKNCQVDQLSPAHTYGNKVKTLLTGLPLTKDELEQLNTDPSAIRPMIESWFATPQADEVLRRFFMMAFQQDQVSGEGIMTMTNINNTAWGRYDDTREDLVPLLIDNMEQSFARTAMKLVRAGRPFSDVLTVDSFEMTTGLMMFYAYLDHRHVNDDDSTFTRTLDEVTGFVGLRNKADEPPAEEVLDPNSPNFMHIWLPDFATLCLAANVNELAFAPNAVNNKVFWVFSALVGRPETVLNRPANVGQTGNPCRAQARRRNPLMPQSDFSDWRTVQVRRPNASESATRFYRVADIRNTDELLINTDRVGFFTTLGFFGTWPTNEDNSSRVTLNQTLITALGASFDGQTVTDFSPPALDAEHSAPNTPCYGCHQTLDPMRDFFRQSYSASYGEQHDDTRKTLNSIFVFRGVQQAGNGVRDLANIVATHPDFPVAWAQKLCFYANAAACPDSAELTAVVDAFKASNLDFRVLVRELFASSLITNASCVSEKTGAGPSIARREQLCAQLSSRLGVKDICGIDTLTRSRSALQNGMLPAITSVPADTFSRGEPIPVTISDTGLFTRATTEVACTIVGESGFDAGFAGLSREDALKKMVESFMGLPEGDPRHDGALDILNDHVTEALAAGQSERNSLRSALVIACMSPSVSGVGF
jgi:hypothetical protein